MEGYKREFIQFLESVGVLKFGDFTTEYPSLKKIRIEMGEFEP